MSNLFTINYEALVTELVEKYGEDSVCMSTGWTELWLPLYRDVGLLIRKLEQQDPRGDHIRVLSSHLAKSVGGTAPYRFSPENLLRMKKYSVSFERNPDLARWEATAWRSWHGRMPSNFDKTLPQEMKEEAQSIFKNSYRLPMPSTVADGDLSKLKESDLEEAFMANINTAMPELGRGFSFMSRQHRAKGNKKHRYDMVFYQQILKCHVIMDLKIGAFKSEYIGQMVDYLQSADMELRLAGDHPTIGIFLCREMDEDEVENTLRKFLSPIGVATFRF